MLVIKLTKLNFIKDLLSFHPNKARVFFLLSSRVSRDPHQEIAETKNSHTTILNHRPHITNTMAPKKRSERGERTGLPVGLNKGHVRLARLTSWRIPST
jgi:hypothetical protein